MVERSWTSAAGAEEQDWKAAGISSLAATLTSQESSQRAPVLLLGIKPFSHLEAAPARPRLSKQMTSGAAGSLARARAPSPRSLMSPAGTGGADAAAPARSCFPRLFGMELIFPSPPQQGPSPGAKPVRCCLPWLPTGLAVGQVPWGRLVPRERCSSAEVAFQEMGIRTAGIVLTIGRAGWEVAPAELTKPLQAEVGARYKEKVPECSLEKNNSKHLGDTGELTPQPCSTEHLGLEGDTPKGHEQLQPLQEQL